MGKIKIAFFAEMLIEEFDGASLTMFQLLKRIPENRFEFLFICGTGPDTLFGFPCIRIPSITLPLNTSYKISLPQLASSRIREALHTFKPDLVHIATPSLLGQTALRYARRRQLPVISIYHTHFISYIDYYFKNLPFLIEPVKCKVSEAQRNFYNQCDRIYVPSESIRQELMGTHIEAERMRIWKRGINAALFSPAKKDPAFIQRITGNQLPTVLFASRLVWEKNLETLFRIYDNMIAGGLPCNMVVAGDGVAAEQCRNRMKKAFFTGRLSHEELSVLYASADVFLFPSVSESYGNVVVEAMASGLPCVIAHGGGSKDFITQGLNGFTCEPYNADDYVDKIARLLNNKALWTQISAEGRRYSLRFDWNELADIYFTEATDLCRLYQTEPVSL